MSAAIPLTYLFVPGSRPERFAKAQASGADRTIIDLEDAVAPADKALARLEPAQLSWSSGVVNAACAGPRRPSRMTSSTFASANAAIA